MDKQGFIIKNMGDHYQVLINHMVVLSKENPFENFRQYLHDVGKEFDTALSKSVFGANLIGATENKEILIVDKNGNPK